MIKNIPGELRNQYELDWVHTTLATVAVDEILYTSINDETSRRDALFRLL